MAIIMLVIVLIQDGAVTSFDEWIESDSDWSSAKEVTVTIVILLCYFATQSYFWHTRGQSIGKIVTRTRIVMRDGTQASWSTIFWKRSLLPSIISNITGIGTLFDFIDLLLIFRVEHNCLHDDFAGTRVIRAKSPASRIPLD